MLYYLLATLYVLACLMLLLVVLLQQGKGGDMASAFGGGGSQTAFGARAGATVLTRATSVLGVVFMLGAIVLGIIGRQGPGSIMSGVAGHAAGNAARGLDPSRSAASGADRGWPGSGRTDRRRTASGRDAAREEVVKYHPPSRKWRNWQTHQLEGLAVAIP
jgi:preprotein translocase subunit SecG